MSDTPAGSLEHSLAQLHLELARAPRLDDQTRERLRAALDDIEHRIRDRRIQEEDVPPGGGDTSDAIHSHPLEALAVGFETDHPSLAASVRRFIDLLGQTGL